ncbi:MAG: hypothetical protein KAT71_04660 [Gammaproteobacteria bacterium]|nr:hypothetical protein [Gammaproteobacteria bacterium]
MKALNIIIISCVCCLLTCCSVPQKPKLTPLQIEALQTREFQTTYETAFSSTISALQNMSYILESANKKTGLITARSLAATEKNTYCIPSTDSDNSAGLVGSLLGEKDDDDNESCSSNNTIRSTQASIMITKVNQATTKIRLSLTDAEYYYPPIDTDKQITQVVATPPYQNMFNNIRQIIFINNDLSS